MDEITVDLENGYLTISAAKGLDKDEEDRRENTFGKSVMQVQCRGVFM